MNGTGNGTIQKIKENVKHPGRKSFVYLGFSLIGGLGSWLVTAGSWSAAVEPGSLGGLLGIIASLGLAWTGESFVKNGEEKP